MKSFVAAVAVPVVLGAQVSPVQKVIELIGELKTKVQNDLKAEGKAMADYSSFCDDESTQKGFAIKTAAREIEGYKAVIEETTGNIQSLQSSIEANGGEAAAKTQELQSATKVRGNENSDFKAAEKELVDAVDTLSRAINIIKREMSFAQGGSKSKVSEKLQAMSGALNAVISAAWLDNSSRKQLKSFLATDMDDELSLKQPQAATYNYENQSGGIVSTLEDMKDKAESSLQNLRREEMKGRQAFELIKQSLTDAVTNLNKAIAEATASSSAASEKLAKAQEDLATTEASKAADEKYKAQLESDCATKAGEWDERQKSATAEIEALNKGQEILSAKFSFAQTSTSVKKMSVKSDETRDSLVAVLKKLGRQFNSFAMMQMASAAAKDPFQKVRGLIESMIAKLEQQANEEATLEAFCQEEMAKSNKAREHKEAASDKYQARIDAAKAGHAELKNEVAQLSEEIAEIEASNQKATEMRNNEHADYSAASKDFKESAEAVTQAMVVLKEFYQGGAAFIQQPSFGGAKSEGSHMIIEILEVAESDFTRLLAEAETSESESLEAYKALMQDNKVAKATKEASVKAKNSEMKSIEVALTHHNEDLATVSTELEAVLDYLAKLKPQCESKAMSYEERKARREAEMAGLNEALSILAGDAAALIQEKGFLKKN